MSVMWHKRQDLDAGLQWLRKLVVKFIRERVERHEMLLSQCCRKAYCAETVKRFLAQRNMDSSDFTPSHIKHGDEVDVSEAAEISNLDNAVNDPKGKVIA